VKTFQKHAANKGSMKSNSISGKKVYLIQPVKFIGIKGKKSRKRATKRWKQTLKKYYCRTIL